MLCDKTLNGYEVQFIDIVTETIVQSKGVKLKSLDKSFLLLTC